MSEQRDNPMPPKKLESHVEHELKLRLTEIEQKFQLVQGVIAAYKKIVDAGDYRSEGAREDFRQQYGVAVAPRIILRDRIKILMNNLLADLESIAPSLAEAEELQIYAYRNLHSGIFEDGPKLFELPKALEIEKGVSDRLAKLRALVS